MATRELGPKSVERTACAVRQRRIPRRLVPPTLETPRRRTKAGPLTLVCCLAALGALAALLLGYGEILFYAPLVVMAVCAVIGFAQTPAQRTSETEPR